MVDKPLLMIDSLPEKQKETAKKIAGLLDGYTCSEASLVLDCILKDLRILSRVRADLL